MSYTIQFKNSALKTLYKLPKDTAYKIALEIDGLSREPRPHGCKKLQGQDNLYRIRIGNYRVVYQVFDRVLVVLVVLVGDRKEIYRRLQQGN
jgi:mRNA interferase RelE/StbE